MIPSSEDDEHLDDEDQDDGGATDDEEPDVPWAGQGYALADPELLKSKSDTGFVVVGVLPQNWIVISVWKRCEPVLIAGMNGPIWGNVPAQEARSAVSLMRVPRRDWNYVFDGVRIMGNAAARVRNEEAEKAAERARREAKRGGKRGR